MDYKIDNIKKIDRGVLRASFDLLVGPFIIKDFLLFQKDNGESWVNSPSRKYESDGEERYFSYVRCQDKDKWESFSNWAADLVLDEIGSNSGPAPTTPDDDDIPF